VNTQPATPRETTRALFGSGVPNAKGNLTFRIRSQDRPTWHTITVKVATSQVHCTCEDFKHHCEKGKPSLLGGRVCKHIATYKRFLGEETLKAQNATMSVWIRGGTAAEQQTEARRGWFEKEVERLVERFQS
jgi:hypothetical protein